MEQTDPIGQKHWSALTERGRDWGLRISATAYRVFGRTGCLIIISPVILYFFLTGAEQRRASRTYLSRVTKAATSPSRVTWLSCYRHFLTFAGSALDSLAAWSGRLSPESLRIINDQDLRKAERSSDGALFIVSHLGNADISRALLDESIRNRMTILVHTKHAVHYNDMLRRYNPAAAVNTLQVTDIGPETTINLQERIDRGEWVFIAGDRTPVSGQMRVTRIPFLGKEAAFAQGPYILASLLKCPVYVLFCLRAEQGFELHVEKIADRITLPRQDRDESLRRYTESFTNRLEHYVIKAPYQWYNFFDFWA